MIQFKNQDSIWYLIFIKLKNIFHKLYLSIIELRLYIFPVRIDSYTLDRHTH